ncbi:MAG: acyltransferase [Promethearchaeota archaeon]
MEQIKNAIKSSLNKNRKPINLKIYPFTKMINPEYIYVGDNVIIDDFCLLYAKEDAPIKIGSWVHIVNFASLTGGPINIGNFVAIGGGSRILGGTDHYEGGALMNGPIPENYRNIKRLGCIIEDFCFIGVNCIIFPGVKIGEGAVIGAGSIVRENIEPWGIYVMKNGKMKQIKKRDEYKTKKNANSFLKKIGKKDFMGNFINE